MCNVDRHAGNILIKKTTHKPTRNSANPSLSSSTPITTTTLVPIDQGFSLPDTLEGITWFEWMNWPQSKVVFDDETKAYIQRLDVDRDIQILQRELGIRAECLNVMKITTSLLKKACEMNLTLYDIGLMMCRKQHSLISSMMPPASTPASTPSSSSMHSNYDESNVGSPSFLELIIEKTKQHIQQQHQDNSNSNHSSQSTSTTASTITTHEDHTSTNADRDILFLDLLPSFIEQEIRNRFPSTSSSECKYYTPSTSRRN